MSPRQTRLLWCCLGLVVTTSLVVRLVRQEGERSRIDRAWEAQGIADRHLDARQSAGREIDPLQAELVLARSLLVDSLDIGRLVELDAEAAAAETERIRARLGASREISEEAIRRRPTSWAAATLIGGTRWLDRVTAGESLAQGSATWEDPLLRAHELSPTSIEPERLLMASRLGRWHTLSDLERTESLATLSRLLRDPRSLHLLLPAWMAIADPQLLFESLPDDTAAWARVTSELARQGRWNVYCQARTGHRARLRAELARTLAEARERQRGGDRQQARRAYLEVLQRSEPGQDQAELFSQALTEMPPGPLGASYRGTVEAWTEWALPLWTIGRPSLTRDAFRRLSGFENLLSPENTALAAIAAGDLERAEIIERRSNQAWSESWAPYVLGKARHLLEAGKPEEARRALDQVHRSAHRRPLYRQLASGVGLAPPEPSTESVPGVWSATDWAWRGTELSLTLEVADDGRLAGNRGHLTLVIDSAQPVGAPFDVQWDGRPLACVSAAPGTAWSFSVEAGPGIHRLRLTHPRGSRTEPGSVTLEPEPVPSVSPRERSA